ncbi:hypothetical protein [Sphingomonas sanxanigenens]|nr:hypothetical protein [Sphingomonas sanxanigenens]
MSLSNDDQNHIRNADGAAVEIALGALSSLDAISANNAFADYRITHAPPYTAGEADNIRELMAIGFTNHCIDGWAFLSRAMAALLAGDNHAVRHFAYYAELRGGMSLLAAAGIGIFNRSNIVTLNGGELETLQPEGTHVAVWEALDAWLPSQTAAQLIAGSLEIAGISLGECLNILLPGAGGAAVYSLSTMVFHWGLDLKQARADKHTREISSYDPHALFPVRNTADDAFNFTAILWKSFEPAGIDRYDEIDRHILRTALQHYFDQGHTISEGDYNRLPTEVRSIASFEFLTSSDFIHEHPLIIAARDNIEPAPPFAMLARAALLMRTATSVTRAALRKTGLLAPGFVRPWLTKYAADRAIVDEELPDIADELWHDIDDAITRIRTLQTDAGQRARTFTRWVAANDPNAAVPRLSEFERVALWSFAV